MTVFGLALREFSVIYLLIVGYIIPQYIFGVFFLKTKMVYKFVIPLVTALLSFSCLFLISMVNSEWLICVVLCLPIAIVWEGAYHVLRVLVNNQETNATFAKKIKNDNDKTRGGP